MAITTTIQIAKDSGFEQLVYNETAEDSAALSRAINCDTSSIPYGVQLHARMKYTNNDPNHSEPIVSPWSRTVKFTARIPVEVVGICLDNRSSVGCFYWIDEAGQRLSEFDYHEHPIFSKITMVTEDASRSPVTMTRIPLFYVKTAASGPSNTFASGMKCWWISDRPAEGFRPCLAFKRSTLRDSNGKYIISPDVKIGTYLAHQESASSRTVLGSKKGQTPLGNNNKETFKNYIQARNNGGAGQAGWRMFDIYDMSVLRLLCLIGKADGNCQAAWGDNASGVSNPRTGSTNARMVFKGTHSDPQVSIDDLWRCYWYHMDLISDSGGRVTLKSPMDLSSTLSTSFSITTSRGWIRDVCQSTFTVGDDVHDAMELFLPYTVNGTESYGTFGDYHTRCTSSVTTWMAGGASPDDSCGDYVNDTTRHGLFHTWSHYQDASSGSYYVARICKN